MTKLRRFAYLAVLTGVTACGSQDPGNPGNGGSPQGGTTSTGGRQTGGAMTGTGGTMTGTGGTMTGTGGTMAGTGGTMAGTGGTMAGTGGAAPPAGGPYFPFKMGNRWEYDVRETGGLTYKKINTIVRMEAIGGKGPNATKMAFRVETRKQGGPATMTVPDGTISWQAQEGSKVVRYREISCRAGSVKLMGEFIMSCTTDVEDYWTPPRIRIDEKPMGKDLAVGLVWNDVYTEFKTNWDYTNPAAPKSTDSMSSNNDRWEVKQIGVSATVPEGTFPNCVVIEKTSTTMLLKRYTFCQGVGKAIEEGQGQTERLSAHKLN